MVFCSWVYSRGGTEYQSFVVKFLGNGKMKLGLIRKPHATPGTRTACCEDHDIIDTASIRWLPSLHKCSMGFESKRHKH